MNLDRWFTIATYAGIVGLIILNASNSVSVLKGASQAINSYVGTVQGRGTVGNVGY